jgi:hypothetical protein
MEEQPGVGDHQRKEDEAHSGCERLAVDEPEHERGDPDSE